MSDEHETLPNSGGLNTFETWLRNGYSLYFKEYGARINAGESAEATPAPGEIPDFARYAAHSIESTMSNPIAAFRTSQMVYGLSTWWAKELAKRSPAAIKNMGQSVRDQFANIRSLAGPLFKALGETLAPGENK